MASAQTAGGHPAPAPGAVWMLAVERSTATGGVALYRGRDPVQCVLAHAADGRGWDLCSLVDRVLAAAGRKPAEIGRFGVGLGPGSYSGIRSSLAFLQGLALPSSARVEGVCSAAALALQAFRRHAGEDRVAVVGDARRDLLWLAIYRRASMTLRDEGGIRLVPRDTLRKTLPEGLPVFSPDWVRLEELLRRSVPPERLFREPRIPGADAVAELLLDPEAPRIEPAVPVYLHPAVVARSDCGGRQASLSSD